MFADLLWQRFSQAAEKLSLMGDKLELTTELFSRSSKLQKQLDMFE